MSSFAAAVFDQMQGLLTDYAGVFAVPIGICAFGLVLAVVINALRSK